MIIQEIQINLDFVTDLRATERIKMWIPHVVVFRQYPSTKSCNSKAKSSTYIGWTQTKVDNTALTLRKNQSKENNDFDYSDAMSPNDDIDCLRMDSYLRAQEEKEAKDEHTLTKNMMYQQNKLRNEEEKPMTLSCEKTIMVCHLTKN